MMAFVPISQAAIDDAISRLKDLQKIHFGSSDSLILAAAYEAMALEIRQRESQRQYEMIGYDNAPGN
jgi:hypothetical protein